MEEVEALEHRDVGREPDGEGRQQDVPGNDPHPLQARQQYWIECHGRAPRRSRIEPSKRATADRPGASTLQSASGFMAAKNWRADQPGLPFPRRQLGTAADAHDCIMVRVLGPTEYKVVARLIQVEPVSASATNSRRERASQGQRPGRDFGRPLPIPRDRDWDLSRLLRQSPGKLKTNPQASGNRNCAGLRGGTTQNSPRR
jgi:hypothetical protein